jgi:DNA helicase-2/ATP-dependent DNA helicase PcrA
MAITHAQRAVAEQRQWAAAQDAAPQVRLVAGPGTGKSKTIEKRVAHILNGGATPQNVYVISFTVAAAKELRERITQFCANQPCAAASVGIRVSTMHSLALRILRSANLLAVLYPHDPIVLDDWERTNIYDLEFANTLGCTPGRAAEIRLAHDAAWQTLNPQSLNQAAITAAEVQGFNAFHQTRTNLYSCVLPGELVYRCVQAIQMGQIQPAQLPVIDHLVVDEFQDLNACDQEFVSQLAGRGARLFIAGDDDQSIYSFRHADPSGIVNFNIRYPQASTHMLDECFRCTPNVLNPASTMIAFNPGRLAKNLASLYQGSAPPVMGRTLIWSFASEQDEAAAVAESCRELINSGMAGREDEIVILISDRGLQLGFLAQALGNLGLPYDPPRGEALTNDEGIRAVYCMLRIAKDLANAQPDYISHRALLCLLTGVGATTAKGVADECVSHHQNFHDLFYLAATPQWLSVRQGAAVARVTALAHAASGWSLADTLAARSADLTQQLGTVFTGAHAAATTASWTALVATLPGGMTLDELLSFFAADTDADRRSVLDSVNQRLGGAPIPAAPPEKRIRILTMHGAKGLSGKVVFVPSVEQGIMPSFRAIYAAGLLIEHRRLFYVSVTRAMAACIISHSALHAGATAFRLRQQPRVMLPRSQFLNEMGIASTNRAQGLSPAEAAQIVGDIGNL